MKIVIYAVVVMLVSVFSYAAGESAERVKNDAEGERVVVREIQSEPVIPDGKEEFTKVVERVLPTVVGIETVQIVHNGILGHQNLCRHMIVLRKKLLVGHHQSRLSNQREA